jgi:hypothetical protein
MPNLGKFMEECSLREVAQRVGAAFCLLVCFFYDILVEHLVQKCVQVRRHFLFLLLGRDTLFIIGAENRG